MATESAEQIQYRQEYIAEFETNATLLRDTVTTEAVVKGNQARFLVAGSGGASAVTRGINGNIPTRGLSNTTATATLVEWHDLPRTTDFNIFQSQGDQRMIMQRSSVSVMNRKIDDDIITELATGTVNTGAAVTGSVALVLRAKTILGLAKVPWDSNITGLITPAMEAYLMQTKEFASVEYINNKPMGDADAAWRDRPTMFRWLGVNWITHPDLPGVGTAAESCFMYHKSALGHAVDIRGIRVASGYNDEQDYSWQRASCYMGPQILQNAGIVVIAHDGSALVAA